MESVREGARETSNDVVALPFSLLVFLTKFGGGESKGIVEASNEPSTHILKLTAKNGERWEQQQQQQS